MQRMLTPQRRLALISTLLIPLLAACSKPEEPTMGQRLDDAVQKTEQVGQEMKQEAREAADKAAKALDDAAISTRITAALAADGELKATRIDVDTRSGEVTLTGSVPSEKALVRATDLAKAVDGVKRVDNRLAIERQG